MVNFNSNANRQRIPIAQRQQGGPAFNPAPPPQAPTSGHSNANFQRIPIAQRQPGGAAFTPQTGGGLQAPQMPQTGGGYQPPPGYPTQGGVGQPEMLPNGQPRTPGDPNKYVMTPQGMMGTQMGFGMGGHGTPAFQDFQNSGMAGTPDQMANYYKQQPQVSSPGQNIPEEQYRQYQEFLASKRPATISQDRENINGYENRRPIGLQAAQRQEANKRIMAASVGGIPSGVRPPAQGLMSPPPQAKRRVSPGIYR